MTDQPHIKLTFDGVAEILDEISALLPEVRDRLLETPDRLVDLLQSGAGFRVVCSEAGRGSVTIEPSDRLLLVASALRAIYRQLDVILEAHEGSPAVVGAASTVGDGGVGGDSDLTNSSPGRDS